MPNHSGFSLFEILIVLVMMSILFAFSFPLYSEHIAHARRLEAEITLEKLAAVLEQYYTIYNTYQDATLNKLGFPDTVSKNNYTLIIATANDTEFSLQAKPLENQAALDYSCATLTLNSSGEKGITGTANISDCWF